MVVFEDGAGPQERIPAVRRSRGATDDLSAISEVMRRRFARYLDARAETGELGAETATDPDRPGIDPATGRPRKFAYPPQLVVVDGGAAAGQRGRRRCCPTWASPTWRCAGWPSGWRRCGCPTSDFPVILPRTSEGLYLLQRVRDEAHRFAITFHRQRRSKRMTASALDNVPGLGEIRRKALLRHFGSLKRLGRPASRRSPRCPASAGARPRRSGRAEPPQAAPTRSGRGRPAARRRDPADGCDPATTAELARPTGRSSRARHRRHDGDARHRTAARDGGRRAGAGRTATTAWRRRESWMPVRARCAERACVTSERGAPSGDGADEPTATRPDDDTDLVVVTGVSGGGRSTVARALENVGFYVVDNLPQALMLRHGRARVRGRRRGPAHRDGARRAQPRVLHRPDRRDPARCEERGFSPRVVFVDADDEVLIRRFESVRRSHPLQGDGRLADGIAAERKLLEEAREQADVIIDTSHLNVNQLRRRVEELFGGEDARRLRVTVLSFGFKYGLPPDADFVLDARFLPNPFWVPELREHTGRDEAVSGYVLGQHGAAHVRRDVRPPDHRDRARLRARGQALPDRRRRLHRRQAPQRRDRRGAGRPGCARSRLSAHASAPRPGARVSAARDQVARSAAGTGWPPRCARCGAAAGARPRHHRGGHGRRRRRVQRPAAGRAGRPAAGRPAPGAGRAGRRPARHAADRRSCFQHRFAPGGRDRSSLAGHPVGNLVLRRADGAARRPGVALWITRRAMVGAAGRVLPMAGHAGRHRGRRAGRRPGRPGDVVTVRGQHAVAVTPGHVEAVRLTPADAARLPGGARRDRRRRLADLRAGQLVHQRASRTCWCPSWPPRSWPARPAGWSR